MTKNNQSLNTQELICSNKLSKLGKVKQRETTRKRKATLNILKAKPLPPKRNVKVTHLHSWFVLVSLLKPIDY